jgi:uncharacterized membrane protein
MLFCYIISFAIVVLTLFYFTGTKQDNTPCWESPVVACGGLLLCLIFSGISIHPSIQECNPKAGLLQAAMITIYTLYLMGSAISNNVECLRIDRIGPLQDQNAQDNFNDRNKIIMRYAGIVSAVIALVNSAFDTGSKTLFSSSYDKNDDEVCDDEQEATSYTYSFFHLIFILATFYVTAVITNWSSDSLTYGITRTHTNAAWSSYWAKVASAFSIEILFTWTIVVRINVSIHPFGNFRKLIPLDSVGT